MHNWHVMFYLTPCAKHSVFFLFQRCVLSQFSECASFTGRPVLISQAIPSARSYIASLSSFYGIGKLDVAFVPREANRNANFHDSEK